MRFFRKLTAAISVMAIAASMAAIPALALTDDEALASRLVKDTDFTVVDYKGEEAATTNWFNASTAAVNSRADYILDFGLGKAITLTEIRIYGAGTGQYNFYGSDTYDNTYDTETQTYTICSTEKAEPITSTKLVNGSWQTYSIDTAKQKSYRYIYMTLQNHTSDDKAYEIVLVGTKSDKYSYEGALKKDTDFTVVNGAGTATNNWFNQQVESSAVNDRAKYILDFGENKKVTLTQIDVYGMGSGAFKFYGSDTYDDTYAVCTDANLIQQVNLTNDAWVSTTIENAKAYRYIYMTLANDGAQDAYRDKAKEIVLRGTVADATPAATSVTATKDTEFKVGAETSAYRDAEVWTLTETGTGTITSAKWNITAKNSSDVTDTRTVDATIPTITVDGGGYNFGLVLYNIPDGVSIAGVTVTVE